MTDTQANCSGQVPGVCGCRKAVPLTSRSTSRHPAAYTAISPPALRPRARKEPPVPKRRSRSGSSQPPVPICPGPPPHLRKLSRLLEKPRKACPPRPSTRGGVAPTQATHCCAGHGTGLTPALSGPLATGLLRCHTAVCGIWGMWAEAQRAQGGGPKYPATGPHGLGPRRAARPAPRSAAGRGGLCPAGRHPC